MMIITLYQEIRLYSDELYFTSVVSILEYILGNILMVMLNCLKKKLNDITK